MNKEWSQLNKSFQANIRQKDTFNCGILQLFQLRKELMDALLTLRSELTDEAFSECPFANVSGYHNKTIAYSVWHIFRIEDIVANSVICNDEQVFFTCDFQRRTNSPIATTGNELVKQQLVDFSRELNIDELFNYALQVKESTEAFLCSMDFSDLHAKPNGSRGKITDICVSSEENAVWLTDYWFKKDVLGLIYMPFSRHWIMHIEAALRIKNKLLSIK